MTHHHPAFRRIAPALALLFPALLPAPALAAEPAPGHGDDHHDHDQDIVVTGLRKAASDAVSGVTVLDGAALAGEVRASLGETLARQPGVSATSFAVTGDGSTATQGGNDSGGIIQNTTGDGVVLTSSTNVTLQNMTIGNPAATAASTNWTWTG